MDRKGSSTPQPERTSISFSSKNLSACFDNSPHIEVGSNLAKHMNQVINVKPMGMPSSVLHQNHDEQPEQKKPNAILDGRHMSIIHDILPAEAINHLQQIQTMNIKQRPLMLHGHNLQQLNNLKTQDQRPPIGMHSPKPTSMPRPEGSPMRRPEAKVSHFKNEYKFSKNIKNNTQI